MQPLNVDSSQSTLSEPSSEDTLDILKGLQSKYEDFHHVSYTDEALEACVRLSHRYVQDRFLPDKAIDLLDEAGSKMNLSSNYTSTDEIEKRLKEIAQEKDEVLKKEEYEKQQYFAKKKQNL